MFSQIPADPLVVLTIRWSLAIVFGMAAFHKARDVNGFSETLRAYRMIPGTIAYPAACILIAAELVVAAGLVLNRELATKAAIVLLCLYAAAMAINLVRGRSDLDCGCGGPAGHRKISGGLVVRNLVLASLAGVTLWPAGFSRNLTWLDGFTALAASATLWLLGSAVVQLSSTRIVFRNENPARGR